jgi:hypothetical protein
VKGMRSVAYLLAGTLLLAACGGDGEESASPTPAAVTSSSTAPTEPTQSEDAGDPTVFGAAECAEALSAWGSAQAAAAQAVTSSPDDLDLSIAELEAFADAAPEEIREDLTLIYEAYGEFLQALEDSGYDPTSGEAPSAETIAAITAASEQLSEPELTAASDRVTAWFDDNCGS